MLFSSHPLLSQAARNFPFVLVILLSPMRHRELLRFITVDPPPILEDDVPAEDEAEEYE